MASLPATPLSEEQYLQIERRALTKSEFHDGQMFAMAGGSPNHSLLARRMGALLSFGSRTTDTNGLRAVDRQAPPGCRIFNADMRIKVASAGLYTYADCSVLCGEPHFSATGRTLCSIRR